MTVKRKATIVMSMLKCQRGRLNDGWPMVWGGKRNVEFVGDQVIPCIISGRMREMKVDRRCNMICYQLTCILM